MFNKTPMGSDVNSTKNATQDGAAGTNAPTAADGQSQSGKAIVSEREPILSGKDRVDDQWIVLEGDDDPDLEQSKKDLAAAYNYLGKCSLKAGSPQQAFHFFRRARNWNPNSKVAAEGMADAYAPISRAFIDACRNSAATAEVRSAALESLKRDGIEAGYYIVSEGVVLESYPNTTYGRKLAINFLEAITKDATLAAWYLRKGFTDGEIISADLYEVNEEVHELRTSTDFWDE